jgi:hypothetical protein
VPADATLGQAAQAIYDLLVTLPSIDVTVQISLQAQRQGGVIAVAGLLPIVFADYGFSGPNSFAVVAANDHGTMELHLLFASIRPVQADVLSSHWAQGLK